MDLSEKDILIRVTRTPNPQAVKLTANFLFKKGDPISLTKKEEVPNVALLFELFKIPGIIQLYTMENQITLSHDGRWEFDPLAQTIETIVRKLGPDHKADFAPLTPVEKPKRSKKPLSKSWKKAEEILDRCVRPGLQADGGDLEIVSFEGNKVEIAYQGACGGCPSSYMGTLEAIENILRHEMANEQIEVYPV